MSNFTQTCILQFNKTSLNELKSRTTVAVNLQDALKDVWDEFKFRLNVVCGGRIEHL